MFFSNSSVRSSRPPLSARVGVPRYIYTEVQSRYSSAVYKPFNCLFSLFIIVDGSTKLFINTPVYKQFVYDCLRPSLINREHCTAPPPRSWAGRSRPLYTPSTSASVLWWVQTLHHHGAYKAEGILMSGWELGGMEGGWILTNI